MGARNTREAWGWVSKSFHWIIALIIIGTSILAITIVHAEEGVPENIRRYLTYIKVHKWFGFTAFALIVLRLAWALNNTKPATSHAPNPWEARLATAAHVALYVLMIGVPILGWLSSSSFGRVTTYFNLFVVPNIWPKDPVMIKIWHPMHKYGAWALLAMSAAHVLAALWHHFVRKDDVLKLMLPTFGKASVQAPAARPHASD